MVTTAKQTTNQVTVLHMYIYILMYGQSLMIGYRLSLANQRRINGWNVNDMELML